MNKVKKTLKDMGQVILALFVFAFIAPAIVFYWIKLLIWLWKVII